jgi:DNA-binding NtrC family response regulator
MMADRILVVDDEELIRESIGFLLRKEGFTVEEAANGREAYKKILAEPFDIVLTDLEMPKMKGLELLEKISQLSPQTLVLIITAYGSLETAITALRHGAVDYILKPVEFDELLVKIRRLLEYKKLTVENQLLRRELQREYDFTSMVGKSPAMKRVFDMIQTVASTDSTVLITGKSGTGKELVARAIHFNSPRKSKPFFPVNCGAIPETLFESELFGHKKGAFTGALADKDGYFKAAEGGTLFLDEISETPLNLQVKLLRVIEQKEFTPVGSPRPIAANVRLVASTNRDLLEEVKNGKFREDLYYRLNVVELKLPSLAERREDIPLLVEHFVDKYRREMNKDIKGVDDNLMRLLMNHEWKGEIRELENTIERAVIFSKDEFISLDDLPGLFGPEAPTVLVDETQPLDKAKDDFERQYILMVLRKNNSDKRKAAEILKLSLSSLYRRMKELGVTE